MRSLYQHLRSAKTPSLRQDLVSGTLSAQQLVDMSPAVSCLERKPTSL